MTMEVVTAAVSHLKSLLFLKCLTVTLFLLLSENVVLQHLDKAKKGLYKRLARTRVWGNRRLVTRVTGVTRS